MKNEAHEVFSEVIKVNPYSHLKVHLGTFKEGRLPNGFAVEILDEDEDAVTTEVASYSSTGQTKIFLLALNSSDKVIRISVQQV